VKTRKTLIIASFGLQPKHVTLETLAVLKKCGVVFSHCLEKGGKDLLARSCTEFESLRGLSLEETAGKVKKAFSAYDTVGFVTYGNPFFLNATTALINREMAGAGISVTVLPAVSSFDSIVNLLDLNKFSLDGLRLVDTAAAMKAMRFTPEMDTLFFVVGDLNLKGNEKYRAAFLKGLEVNYPAQHPLTVINCPAPEAEAGRLLKTTVSKFKTVFSKVDIVSTILVRAVK
jgi:precorrin-2 methylase